MILRCTPWKINGWNLQITHLERKMIFQTSMIMFHVNLQGCIFHCLPKLVISYEPTTTVDGSEIRRSPEVGSLVHQRLVVYPIIYKV